MARNKRSKPGSGMSLAALKQTILGVFTHNPTRVYNYKQMSKHLMMKEATEKRVVNEVLQELWSQDQIEEVSPGKYKLKSTAGYISGKIDITAAGYGFVVSDDMEEDIFISQKNLKHALDGDHVKVFLSARRKGKHPEGEVVEIIERARTSFVGTLEIQERYAFFIADSRKMPYDIFIPLEKTKQASANQKVIVRITDWPAKAKNPFGEVVEVLGKPGENETEIHAILAEYGLPYKFTVEVLEAAEQIEETISDDEVKQRRDFRKITTFTIDPFDAKDFDDALSIQKLDNGHWEIGIHIADVTHYVKPKSIIDEEALNRATSVYLVDRVVPMLPEKLSNKVCSLRPNEEKLCFSAVFELDSEANLLDEWFGRTIIYSDRRFTYEEAQEIIDTEKGDLADELKVMNDIAQKLRAKRFKDGAISFERDEVKFELDENSKPLRVYFKQHGLSNELVEEFMLLANRQVANFVGNKPNKKDRKTFVYRIHDKPDPEKLQRFARFIHRFGHRVSFASASKVSQSLNQILGDVKGKPEQDLVETLAVRSMAKAEYSTGNIGHYGLAFSHYTHFTSPIRRYPDMMVHRMLASYLQNEESKNKAKYEKFCQHSSKMEQTAAEAERASIKFKQVEFMKDKVGQVFEGMISGVTEWGIFVEIIENKCEGLVALRELVDDFYEYDEDNYSLVGKRTGNVFQLGDRVKVMVVRANLDKKQLDFAMATPEGD